MKIEEIKMAFRKKLLIWEEIGDDIPPLEFLMEYFPKLLDVAKAARDLIEADAAMPPDGTNVGQEMDSLITALEELEKE